MHCCGIKGPADYQQVFQNSSLPNSCCTKFPPNSNVCTQQNAIQDGCMPILLDFFNTKSLLLAGVGIGIALIQVRGHVLAIDVIDFTETITTIRDADFNITLILC